MDLVTMDRATMSPRVLRRGLNAVCLAALLLAGAVTACGPLMGGQAGSAPPQVAAPAAARAQSEPPGTPARPATPTSVPAPTPLPTPTPHPLTIAALRAREYPGSDLVIEQTLTPGSNYNRYIASYRSEGLKIYALLTVPRGQRPPSGWPVIIFNHGYIPPAQYRTTERYVAYVDAFARNGYIVLKPDYRGHGNARLCGRCVECRGDYAPLA